MLKHSSIEILLVICLLLLISCQRSSNSDDRSNADQECYLDMDTLDYSFGIKYDDVSTYLIPGEQSDLADTNMAEVINAIGEQALNIEGILNICNWVNMNFVFQNAGGSMIGVPTVDELFQAKTFYGCHSAALIISSILRETGFPVVMIETAMVDWAYDYHNGSVTSFSGHVMSEVYVQDKWILVDNNCSYIEDYNPLNPYINTIDGDGYFAYAKGIDTWDYTGHDVSFTHEQMIFFAQNVYCFEDMFGTVTYAWCY